MLEKCTQIKHIFACAIFSSVYTRERLSYCVILRKIIVYTESVTCAAE